MKCDHKFSQIGSFDRDLESGEIICNRCKEILYKLEKGKEIIPLTDPQLIEEFKLPWGGLGYKP